MAVFIAIVFVAALWLWQLQRGRQAVESVAPVDPLLVEPPLIEPSTDAIRPIAPPPPRPARDPWLPASVPSFIATPTLPQRYAFASPRSTTGPDRTAAIVRIARGKGLCSPHQPPS